jgi:hypothetical protein
VPPAARPEQHEAGSIAPGLVEEGGGLTASRIWQLPYYLRITSFFADV